MSHLTRQYELIPGACLVTPITVIGAGAIGSFTVLSLAKMGFSNLTVYDHDKIEVENMNSQFYRFSDIGKPKVVALKELVKDFTGVEIKIVEGKYTGNKMFPGIVVSAVDSMAVRKMIWEAHRGKSLLTKAVLDPRMGAETAQFYAMNPMRLQDIEAYEKSLYSDSQASHERCTAKAVMYTATMLSGLVAKTVKDIAANQEFARIANWSIKHSQFNAWKAVPAGAVVH